ALKGLDTRKQLFYPNIVNIELIDNIISDIFAQKVECIVCGDDVICTRIMSRLQAEGYRIPKDISIVSLYNSIYLECLSPAVTAVNISARRLGNAVGKQLINCLQGADYQVKTKLDYEILGRKSTGKLYQV
ncbi:MAG: substrate-binding domain-containing protein, partial [Lachnospiraceae bacterium]|nr:substrate-binding domain-containing protein [Lachnospiraceae bacterium]